jgi:hypothetical protein
MVKPPEQDGIALKEDSGSHVTSPFARRTVTAIIDDTGKSGPARVSKKWG